MVPLTLLKDSLRNKSREVTEKELYLGQQKEGEEKFQATHVSRIVVGSVLFAGNVFSNVFPRRVKKAFALGKC